MFLDQCIPEASARQPEPRQGALATKCNYTLTDAASYHLGLASYYRSLIPAWDHSTLAGQSGIYTHLLYMSHHLQA